MTINILMIILEYAVLFCICAFIYKVMSAIYHELHTEAYEDKAQINHKAALTILETYDDKLINKRILFSETLTLGRGADNNIILSEAYVSHHHAIISPVKNQYQIEDLRSRNHTYVNGQEIMGKTFLKNGDIIKIGTTVLKFER
ncbi:FHA domain-containing protein [Pectinatus sottacetonis]|uniref:FHA domain-containing protein n=1 Tax=Pectinatus sottacetonis TaxID=1002795 RepID=UPI0018C7C98F|nr:FHA domain-containing protein [Pectinatus sottacetonis]